MLSIIAKRARQGHRTIAFPRGPAPELPDRYRGRPLLNPAACGEACADCVGVCPTGAVRRDGGTLRLDLGRCLFCGECERACGGRGGVRFSREFSLAARARADLDLGSSGAAKIQALDARMRKLFGRSLKLRQVSAGGCNACEADTNVLTTIVFDLGRFGIQFVASPRHADGLLITGPVTANMRLALQKTWEAVPTPKLVVAVGACAISGGPFAGHPEQHDGAAAVVPVDLYIPGCPPHPLTILDGLLRLLGRL